MFKMSIPIMIEMSFDVPFFSRLFLFLLENGMQFQTPFIMYKIKCLPFFCCMNLLIKGMPFVFLNLLFAIEFVLSIIWLSEISILQKKFNKDAMKCLI